MAGSTWSDWILEYDHNLLSNSTELRSLASALGVGKSVGYINSYISSNDANDFFGKFLMGMTSAETTNIPFSTFGFLINFHCGGSDYNGFGLQIWVGSPSASSIYFRTFWNGWGSWREVSSVS